MKDGVYTIYITHIYTIYTNIIYTIYTTIICTIYTKRMEHIYWLLTVYIENMYRCKQDLYHLHIYTVYIQSTAMETHDYSNGNTRFVLKHEKTVKQNLSLNPKSIACN